MSGKTLVLVELGAHRPGGHCHGALVALAKAHPQAVVIAPYGIFGETWAALRKSAVRVTIPHGVRAAALSLAAVVADHVAAVTKRVLRSRCWPTAVRRLPHQVTLVAHCLAEAACVRTAHHFDPGAVVVLSASEGLHGLAGLLGGPHLRFVHEVITTEDAALRLLGRLARGGERRVELLAPTETVRVDLARQFPRLQARVRPFAVADAGDRLTDGEVRQARDAFGIPAGAAAVCMVGGWWPHKDIDTVSGALAQLHVPLHVLVTGAPLRDEILNQWRALPTVRLHLVPGAATMAEVRTLYAAADAAVVARHPGVAKESGLVVDSVRLGVPLLTSDHDPALVAGLAGQPWARTFPAGDATALAALLCDLAWKPLPRPGANAAAELGVPTAVEQVAFFTNTDSEEFH